MIQKINNIMRTLAVFIALLVLFLISLGIYYFTDILFLQTLRIVFGSVYVLFLPGFVISFIFFPQGEKSIDYIERVALSFALSIAIVPLAVFYLNLLGVRINFLNSFFTILGIIVISCAILLWKSKRTRQIY